MSGGRASGGAERCPAGTFPRALEPLLEPLSGIYLWGYALRRFSYAAGLKRSRRLPCAVVSVGNITVGGTGKTPFVEMLAEGARSRGKSVAILSRGYGREKAGRTPRIVSDGKNILLDWKESGDEPHVLANNLAGVPIIVGSDRYEAGRVAVERFAPSLLILDDGFQHWGLARDCDIVLLDARKPLGSLRVLPRGSLREPLGALRRGTIFVLTHCDRAEDIEGFVRGVKEIAGEKPVFRTRHEAAAIGGGGVGGEQGAGEIVGRPVLLVSGIAQPETFEDTVRGLGGNIVRHMRYPDHHVYTERDRDDIGNALARSGAETILTTQKDAAKLRELVSETLPVRFVRIRIAFENDNETQRFWSVFSATVQWL